MLFLTIQVHSHNQYVIGKALRAPGVNPKIELLIPFFKVGVLLSVNAMNVYS